MSKSIMDNQDSASWIYISRVKDAMLVLRVKELRSYNVTARQSSILLCLEALGDNTTPAELSRWAFRKPHSISNLLKRMEREGFVRRLKDLDKKNMIRIEVTEKGRKAISLSKRMEAPRRVMRSLSKEEHRQLKIILDKLWHNSLEELGIKQRPMFPPSSTSGQVQ